MEKLIHYGRYGGQEYWLVNPMTRTAMLYGNVRGQLVAISAQAGVLRSQLLTGFWLRMEWIFSPVGEAQPGDLAIARELGLIGN